MDGLSVAASIVAIVQITGGVIAYLSDVKDASAQCEQCQIEISNSNTLLLSLNQIVSASTSTEPWSIKVQALAKKDGPLDQYRLALEGLLVKVEPKSKLRKTIKILLWSLVKDDVALVLARIERVKTHVMNIFQVTNL
jgi:predicted ribosomally synthesized peptide with SipW-like signal peptide